jgi:hypothetical protein|tara:strand:- start:792 stop:1274 length:483 start_codon:yes stop_codon:yes gene_type:complete
MNKEEHSKELNEILNLSESIESKQDEQTEDVAFSSSEALKGIISKEEFSSVIVLLTNIVLKIADSSRIRQEAKNKALEKFEELKERGIDDEDKAIVVKMIKKELMKTDIKMYESFGDEFENLTNTIDFLNRFKVPEEMIPHPNLSWISRVKKYLNSKKEK